VIYGVFKYVCHQLADRTLSVGGLYLPCCARCAGIYSGFAFAAGYHLFVNRRGFKLWPTRAAAVVALAVLGINFFEYIATWWFGLFGGLSDYSRFVLSLSLGWAGFVLLAASATFVQFPKNERPRDNFTGVVPGFALSLTAALLPLVNSKPAWYILAWAAVTGMVLFYGFFNYFPAALFIRATGWRPAFVGYISIIIVIAAALVGEWYLHRALFEEITTAIRFIYEFVGLV
jgi:uncharacterized membrane protein